MLNTVLALTYQAFLIIEKFSLVRSCIAQVILVLSPHPGSCKGTTSNVKFSLFFFFKVKQVDLSNFLTQGLDVLFQASVLLRRLATA
jgi:hypothetical protein